MSQAISRLSFASLFLLVSCAGSPVAQVTTPAKPAVATPAIIRPPSQEQLKNLQLKLMDDDSFADSLQKNPKAAIKAQGISLADSEQVKVLPIGSKIYMVLDDRNLQTFHANLLNQPDSEKSDLQKLLDLIRMKANNDPDFKQQLLSKTAETLKATGIDESLAAQFEVIDYQPNTSLLMVAPLGTEITRGVGDDIRKFFTGLPDKLLDALVNAIDKLKLLAEGPEKTISKAAVAATSDGLVVASTALCVATIGLVPFFCKDGKDKSFWTNHITEFLASQKYLLIPVNTAKILQLETQIKQAEADLTRTQDRLTNLRNARDLLEKTPGDNPDIQARRRELDMQIAREKVSEGLFINELVVLKTNLARAKSGN